MEGHDRIVSGYLRNTINVTITNQTWLSINETKLLQSKSRVSEFVIGIVIMGWGGARKKRIAFK